MNEIRLGLAVLLGVLLEGVVDGVGVEQQMNAALADLEEPLRIQHDSRIG